MGLFAKIASFIIHKILRLPDTVSTVGADLLINEAVAKAAPIVAASAKTEDIPIETDWTRKYISMIAYDNPNRQFYALTFEDNDVDREQELVQALVEFFGSEGFVFSSDYGYSSDSGKGSPIFPDIEVSYL